VSTNFTAVAGDVLVKCDNGTTDFTLLNWCKSNIAPNYQGYKLHYKLSQPEPITDSNVHYHGDDLSITTGDNYIVMDSGMVLGEVANPIMIPENETDKTAKIS
jgi:hypothetical protein